MSADSDNEVLSHSNEDDSTSSESTEGTKKIPCSKLLLPEHLAAYLEDRVLDRGVEPITCDRELIENIFSNYVIVKNIISHLRWQDKLICKDVHSLWRSAVNRLQYEQLEPVDFSVNLGARVTRKGVRLLKSTEIYTEPMVVIMFCNTVALNVYTMICEGIVPSPCSPACDKEHSILDLIYNETTAPRDCMYAVKAYSMSYFPLPQSITVENMIHKPPRGSEAFFCGVYIPKIPGVEFQIININCTDSVQQGLSAEIKQLTSKYTVKGVIAFLTDNYLLYVDEHAECLGFLRTMQPNIPFAYAGCLVEDTVNKAQDMAAIVDSVNKGREFISGNVISLGLFVTPKVDNTSPNTSAVVEPSYNFEVYSFILESEEWSKFKIQVAIQEFSERVPRFEHSIALKFSCMGRQHKHETEQHYFRTYFPHTRLAGCFGNGELGVNHPKRKQRAPTASKRAREDVPYDKVYAYCTVFFYIGWGKVIAEALHVD